MKESRLSFPFGPDKSHLGINFWQKIRIGDDIGLYKFESGSK